MSQRIAICLGDVTGIGPEITVKALAHYLATEPAGTTRYLVFGDPHQVRVWDARLGTRLPLGTAPDASAPIQLQTPESALSPNLPTGSPVAARAAIDWLRAAAESCLAQTADAMVTAPVNKEAIIRAGIPFVGQTELLSEIASTRTVMMLLGPDPQGRWVRVALATTHLPLKAVAATLTADHVELAITLAIDACRQLRLPRARVAVCGLNPHAGEGGELGDEEQTIIGPVIARLRARHQYDLAGPLPADTVFHQVYQGEYDVVVAMYHDQGLPPLKMVAFDQGVNWTLGLPFVRTSPDHGTAYNIAGRGIANPSSMIAAIHLARQLTSAGT